MISLIMIYLVIMEFAKLDRCINNTIYFTGIAISIKDTDLGWDDKKPYLHKYFIIFFMFLIQN